MSENEWNEKLEQIHKQHLKTVRALMAKWNADVAAAIREAVERDEAELDKLLPTTPGSPIPPSP